MASSVSAGQRPEFLMFLSDWQVRRPGPVATVGGERHCFEVDLSLQIKNAFSHHSVLAAFKQCWVAPKSFLLKSGPSSFFPPKGSGGWKDPLVLSGF